MYLKAFLYEIYKQQGEEEEEIQSAIRYAYKMLSYLDDGNEPLQTKDVLHFGEERERELTGEEVLEKGVYTMWTGAHDGIELLQRFETMGEALQNKKQWDEAAFSPCDFCGLLEVDKTFLIDGKGRVCLLFLFF